jgi:electron transport complex protein RnfE
MLVFNENYRGFLLAILPPGAFFGLAFLIVIKNIIGSRLKQESRSLESAPETA